MVDNYIKDKKYDYLTNANKVVINDRNIQRTNDPSGEADNLRNYPMHKFGDKAIRDKPPKIKPPAKSEPQKKKKKKIPEKAPIIQGMNINDITNSEQLLYKPKTKDTLVIYEELLTLVSTYLLDQPPEFIKSAWDLIIGIIKTENEPEEKKLDNIHSVVSELSKEVYVKMVQLCKGLIDFETDETGVSSNANNNPPEIDVNIEFDELGNESDNDGNQDAKEQKHRNHEISDEDMEVEGGEEEEKPSNITNNAWTEEIKQENLEQNEIEHPNSQEPDGDMLTEYAIWSNKFWLQVFIKEKLKMEDNSVLQLENEIMKILGLSDWRECENQIVFLLKHKNFPWIKFLLKHKRWIYFTTKLGKCQEESEKHGIVQEMCATPEGMEVYERIKIFTKSKKKKDYSLWNTNKHLGDSTNIKKEDIEAIVRTTLNLENMTLTQGGHYNSNKNIRLPKGTYKETKWGYEEIFIPPQISEDVKRMKEIKISSLPEWMHKAFQTKDESNNYQFINDTFNKVQSKVLETALNTSENLLICAPTSSGKTNIAVLTIWNLINQHRNPETGSVHVKNFKVIFIAPMKALVKETVGNLSQRWLPYNISVGEWSGDINLTKYEIETTNIIVTTPEKWDIITRKGGDDTYSEKVQLIIIDEIHLLHDTRGAVWESIVARTIRRSNSRKEVVRLVALSATLPNYKDVSDFCHVNAKKGLFYFDTSYRPIPLEQRYIGITEKKGIKKLLWINEITYEKVTQRIEKSHQVIIFVHSRRETTRTAKTLLDMAAQKGELSKFKLSQGKWTEFNAIWDSDLSNNMIKDKEWIELYKHGIGVHHAGMARDDKELVEEYFNNGYLNIIVSTATLAWGVNLPAHSVIIKGTQIYDPEKGQWVELSHLDIMQMMGRAGRVGYHSTVGEGIIITSFNELQYYWSLLNQQWPIESQLIQALPDSLNAEIVAGSISSIEDGINWLSYTYWYIRMLKSPNIYGISDDTAKEDKYWIKRRTDLIHTAAVLWEKHGLIKYNIKTGELSSTQLGKVSSYYYIKYQSIGVFNEYLKPEINIIDIFRWFSLSNEFKWIPIRSEEKKEVEKWLLKVPVPVKGSNEEPSSKINILLQAYISNFALEGYAISSDMIYISQNAGRIFRALFEICSKRGWANVSLICLNICKMIKLRMWGTMSPLRQFNIIPEEILHKIESKEQLTWDKFYNLTPDQISELIKINKKNSEGICKLIRTFPRLELSANIQPWTRTCIWVELIVTPSFTWNTNYHKRTELFHIFVEDNDSEIILHHEVFAWQEKYLNNSNIQHEEKHISFIVPMIEPMPPQYFIRVTSENWWNCENVLAVYFKHLILPEKFPPYTNWLDLQPMQYSALNSIKHEKHYSERFSYMNSIQTQCFKIIYESNNSVFVGATAGNGKMQIAEMAMIKHFNENKILKSPVIYLTPNEDSAEATFENWIKVFDDKEINAFTGEFTLDSNLFDKSDIIISTFTYFDMFTRKFKIKRNFNEIAWVIIDDIHWWADHNGELETAVTRWRYNHNVRYIVWSTSLSNPNSICDWLNIDISTSCVNFDPNIRQNKLEIFFYGYDSISHKARFNLMTKPLVQWMYKHCYMNSFKLSTMIYVSDWKSAKSWAIEMLAFNAANDNKERCWVKPIKDYEQILRDTLRIGDTEASGNNSLWFTCLRNGIGILYDTIDHDVLDFIVQWYNERIIQVLILTYKMIWKINTQSHIVIIADPVKYDINSGGWIDYSINDMFQIMGRTSITYHEDAGDIPSFVRKSTRKCFVLFQNSKKEFYKKFLLESYPLESQLHLNMQNTLNTEIANGVIKTKQNCLDWLTWTFWYRRWLQNPNYYDMKGQTQEYLNQYLSELIEQILGDWVQAQCIQVNEITNDITALPLGKISSNYYILYNTVDLFNQSLHENSNNLSEIFAILKSAYEFDEIEFNKGDINELFDLAELVPQKYLGDEIRNAMKSNTKIDDVSSVFSDPHNKVLILLLAYLTRIPIPSSLTKVMKEIVTRSSRLILAMVDVWATKHYLKPTLLVMEWSQMIIQAMWITQSPLLQLPNFDKELCKKCGESNIEDIADLMNMDDDERDRLIGGKVNMSEVAEVCNRYPNIEMKATLRENVIKAKEKVSVEVELKRDIDVNVLSPIHSDYYPNEKEESWWVIIGDDKEIKCIKRAAFCKGINIKMEFDAPEEAGQYGYKVYLFSDSWIGCDQDEDLVFEV